LQIYPVTHSKCILHEKPTLSMYILADKTRGRPFGQPLVCYFINNLEIVVFDLDFHRLVDVKDLVGLRLLGIEIDVVLNIIIDKRSVIHIG